MGEGWASPPTRDSRVSKYMRMNNKMSALLQGAGMTWPLKPEPGKAELPELELVHDCVLLKEEYERNKHAKVSDFPDRTGFECFINHVHLPFAGTNESLVACMAYAAALQHSLAYFAEGQRRFRVIVGIGARDCAIRFHWIRSGETWISDNLEGYKSEAILVLDVVE